MNPLTLVKRIQSINAKEADLGISDEASWHAKYKDSAYVFVGGIPYDLTEGDLLAVFAQYGEIVDVNLVRDKSTGKSKGFAFIAYEDQRSTTLAVDNLNGAQIAGRIIRVDHCSNYKKKEEEDEETVKMKREERGVCCAFQRGECKYGDSCKFSHDEQRAANTGWGTEEERRAKWANDKFDNRPGANEVADKIMQSQPSHASKENRADDYDRKRPRGKDKSETGRKQMETDVDLESRDRGRRPEYEEGRDKRTVQRMYSRHEPETKSKDGYDGRESKRLRRHEIESASKDNQDEKDRNRDRGRERDMGRERKTEREKRSSYTRDSSPRRRDRRDDDHRRDRKDDDNQRRERDDFHRSRR